MIIMIITNTMVRFIHIIIRLRTMCRDGVILIILIIHTALTKPIVPVVFAIKGDSCTRDN